jgi:hypothetical protein
MTKQPMLDRRNPSSPFSSLRPLRWVGYGLLALAIFDWVDLLIPLQLMNPAWELQTLGQLVEKVPVLLVGAALVFLGDREEIRGLEKLALKGLSWCLLLLGIVYFLFVPWGVWNTSRLDRQTSQRIAAQVTEARTLTEQARSSLAQVKTPGDLQILVQHLSQAGIALPSGDAPDLETLKTHVQQELTVMEQQVNRQAQQNLQDERLALFKKSLKWNLGALVSAMLLMILWRGSAWARR